MSLSSFEVETIARSLLPRMLSRAFNTQMLLSHDLRM